MISDAMAGVGAGDRPVSRKGASRGPARDGSLGHGMRCPYLRFGDAGQDWMPAP